MRFAKGTALSNRIRRWCSFGPQLGLTSRNWSAAASPRLGWMMRRACTASVGPRFSAISEQRTQMFSLHGGSELRLRLGEADGTATVEAGHAEAVFFGGSDEEVDSCDEFTVGPM